MGVVALAFVVWQYVQQASPIAVDFSRQDHRRICRRVDDKCARRRRPSREQISVALSTRKNFARLRPHFRSLEG